MCKAVHNGNGRLKLATGNLTLASTGDVGLTCPALEGASVQGTLTVRPLLPCGAASLCMAGDCVRFLLLGAVRGFACWAALVRSARGVAALPEAGCLGCRIAAVSRHASKSSATGCLARDGVSISSLACQQGKKFACGQFS